MFHFIKRRKIFYVISILAMLPGLISLALQGLNLGIDFTSGSILEIRFEKAVQVEQVRETVKNEGFEASRIQQSGDRDFLIRTTKLTQSDSQKLMDSFTGKMGKVELLRNEYVDPIISTELFWRALGALAIASVLMVIYITFRFEFKQGIAAIVALLHDTLLVIGIFSLFRIEVDSAFIAAILTIIGYSINDTIIIFDRIRENLRMQKKGQSLEDLVNLSIWQTLARSINTVLTVMFVLLALYFLGGATVKTFVLAMIIGVASGAYSSIFNASPIWVDLRLMDKKGNSKAMA
ncbi:MAG: preprotein translocase subunit SecF [Peptococcaceae bacterium BRH_c4a]|nr:MAG: preprotein translocase subunit SecF [Peptococcaceae bacterium BRH_c4a]